MSRKPSSPLSSRESSYFTPLRQPDFYREVEVDLARLRAGDLSAVSPLIRFLEEDPYLYGSGYLKEKIWRRLRRVPLSLEEYAQLQRIALHYARTRLCREFFPMCRFLSGSADEAFRREVQAYADSEDEQIRYRATLLRAYLEHESVGERVRWETYPSWKSAKARWRDLRRSHKPGKPRWPKIPGFPLDR